MVNLEELQEVLFYPSAGNEPAKTEVIFRGDKVRTTFYDDEAITVWHRLRDFIDGA
jgi:hypothetical protein